MANYAQKKPIRVPFMPVIQNEHGNLGGEHEDHLRGRSNFQTNLRRILRLVGLEDDVPFTIAIPGCNILGVGNQRNGRNYVGMSFVGSKLYSANKLGLNTCFCEHGMPEKNDAQLSCFLSNSKAWGVDPLFDGPHGFLTTHRFFNDLINGGSFQIPCEFMCFFHKQLEGIFFYQCGPPSDVSWFVNTSKYSYLRTINPSDIGVMWPLT